MTTRNEQPANPVSGEGVDVPQPKLDWRGRSNEWGVRVKPGKHGLRLGDLNVGLYGEIPEHWPDQTRNPRGAVPRKGVPPLGYPVRDKVDLWADCAADLYEEAIQRRWAPATDIPWETVQPVSKDLERAICQVCTELCQYANTDIETISSWQHQMAYGYHEVKQFLATATFDAARQFEAFRKRALAGGGGLGLEGPGEVNRMILESRGGWTEAAAYLFLLRGTFTLTLLRYLERHATNDAEAALYAYALQDKARHLTYGLEHLHYACAHQEDMTLILTQLLFIGDRIMARELKDHVLREALAVVFAGGVDKASNAGMAEYERMMSDFMREYMAACAWLGVKRNPELMPPALTRYLAAEEQSGSERPAASGAEQPRLDWLETARKELNQDPQFRKQGSADLVLGLAIGDEIRLVTFEAFEVSDVRAAQDLRDADLTLRMPAGDWNAYLARRADGSGETLLSLDLQAQVFEARRPLDRLLLPRYNLTLQAFVDTGARLAG